MEKSNPLLYPDLLSGGTSRQVPPGRRSPRLGDQGGVNAPSSGARRREKGGWPGQVRQSRQCPHHTPIQTGHAELVLDRRPRRKRGHSCTGHPREPASVELCQVHGNVLPSCQPPGAPGSSGPQWDRLSGVGWTQSLGVLTSPGRRRGRGVGRPRPYMRRASRARSPQTLVRTRQVPTAPAAPSPPLPQSPASSPQKTTSPLPPPPGAPFPGMCGGGRRGRQEGGGDVERRSQPSPPATPTPTRRPSRGAWSGRWGEKARLLWVLRIASSSFSLSRQLRRRGARPGSASGRSGDPQPGARARAMQAPRAAPAAPLSYDRRLGGSSAGPSSLGSHSRCSRGSLRCGRLL